MTNLRRLQDIQIGNDDIISTYRAYFANRYIDAAHNLINTSLLKSFILQAEWMNATKTKIEDLESHKSTEIDQNLANKNTEFQTNINDFLYLNEYNSDVQYYVNNFVLYNNEVYFCIQNALNKTPTNTSYWLNIGLVGETGQYDLGVVYKGEWNASTLYNKYDLVYYNNNFYVALSDNTGNTPNIITNYLNNSLYLNNNLYLGYGENNEYWFLLTKVQPQPIYNFPSDYTTLPRNAMFFEALSWYYNTIIKSASGSILSLPNCASYPAIELNTNIEPVQDLHGQSAPYPAGGGSNIWDEQWEVGGIQGTADPNRICSKNYIPVTGGYTYYIRGARILWQEYDANKAYLRTGLSGDYIGPNTTFTVGADAYYIKFQCAQSYGTTYNHDIAINYPSTVTTYSPYSNVCPISGHTSAVVTRTGKNLWNPEAIDAVSGCTTEFSDDVLKVISQNANALYENIRYKIIPAKSIYGKTIKVSVTQKSKTEGTSPYVFMAQRYEGSYLWRTGASASWAVGERITLSHQITDDRGYVTLTFYASNNTTIPIGDYTEYADIMVEISDTVSDYESPQVQSLTIDLDGTRYGAQLNVLTGEMTVTHKYIEFDGSEDWGTGSISSSSIALGFIRLYTFLPTDAYAKKDATTMSNQLQTYKAISWNVNVESSLRTEIRTRYEVAVLSSHYADVSAWKSHLQNEILQVVYELETPLTVQLSPATLSLLLGENNIWSDTGDTSITYHEIME